MQPQGAGLINQAYYENLIQQINNLNACGELQALVNEAMASIQAEVSAIEQQIASLVPLITLPTDLGSVISWIKNFATPLIKPYLNYISQLEQTLAQIAALTSAIEAAAARLVHCSITVPPIVATVPTPVAPGQ
jgi:hypothetical protein